MAYNFYKKKKYGARVKLTLFFTVILIIFALFFLYINFLVSPLISRVSRAKLKIEAVKAINTSISQTIKSELGYDDFVNIKYNNLGEITLISANAININKVCVDVQKLALDKMLDSKVGGIKIPLGAFSGLSFLSGLGPLVKINFYPYGDVSCKFLSQFLSVGINQTLHKIYVGVSANLRVVLPFKDVFVETFSEVLVCESLIVGKIPDTYLNSNSLSNMLDLIDE